MLPDCGGAKGGGQGAGRMTRAGRALAFPRMPLSGGWAHAGLSLSLACGDIVSLVLRFELSHHCGTRGKSVWQAVISLREA